VTVNNTTDINKTSRLKEIAGHGQNISKKGPVESADGISYSLYLFCMCSYDFHIRLWNCPDDVEFFFIIICRLINYMPILTVRPLIDNKVYLMTTAAYFFFSVHHDFHFRCCSYLLTLTRGVSHVAQELLTLPEHLGSSMPFCGVRVPKPLIFCVVLFVLSSFSYWLRHPSC
jgi:hypothetical protein